MISVFVIILVSAVCFILGMGSLVAGVNAYVMDKGDDTILTSKESEKLEDVDCIIVLG